jgi:hypothetical protein
MSPLEDSLDSWTETPIWVYKEDDVIINFHDIKYTGRFGVFVSIAGQTYTIRVDASYTVADLKAKLSKKTGIQFAGPFGLDRYHRIVTDDA